MIQTSLNGKFALITGGASGIGAATCRLFAEAGAKVLVADISAAAAKELASQLPGALALACDVTREDSVAAALSEVHTLDILVNCAGIGLVGGVTETQLEDWRRLFRVNVDGTFLMTKAALPSLLASQGNIVNIGSVAGLVGVKRRFAYCATKGAIVAMTRQLAVDYPTGLRVNCICPGTVDSPFVEGYLEKYHQHEKEKVRAELHQRQPIGRMGTPEEIAGMCLYLASSQASFIHGSIFTIDGGWTAA